MKASAIAIAAAVYHVAMRDELLPRFTKEELTPPEDPPAAPQPAQPPASPAQPPASQGNE